MRLTFNANYGKQIDAVSAYFFKVGATYDVPDEVGAEAVAAGVAVETPDAVLHGDG